jgi:actin-related protein 10
LYGTDDRVILDLGSQVWKAGFSSETSPRLVISVCQLCKPILGSSDSIWNIHASPSISLIVDAIAIGLTRLFFNHLMIDPKQRKVILIENPLIPTSLRSEIAIVLFDQLHVPSIAFTPSPVLSLMACGILTGLVIDVGNLETWVIPVCPLKTSLVIQKTWFLLMCVDAE